MVPVILAPKKPAQETGVTKGRDNQEWLLEGQGAWRDFEAYLLPNPSFSDDPVMQEQYLLEPSYQGLQMPHPRTRAGGGVPLFLGQQANCGHSQLSLPSPRKTFRAHVGYTRLKALRNKQAAKVATCHPGLRPTMRMVQQKGTKMEPGSSGWHRRGWAGWLRPKYGGIFFSDSEERMTWYEGHGNT